MKILLVEDHQQLAEDTLNYLQKENYLCERASTVAQAQDYLEIYEYDFVLLDLTLPDNSGLYLLDFIRENNITVNVIIISAQDSLDYKIKGLDGGADDYITKPFPLPELHSRIKAVSRRKNPEQSQVLVFNEIKLNLEAVQCQVNDKDIVLTKKEFNLLVYFINNKNRVLSKQAIALHLWGNYTYNLDNVDFIYQHLKNLRKKIIDAGGTDYLTTVYGLGYKWNQ